MRRSSDKKRAGNAHGRRSIPLRDHHRNNLRFRSAIICANLHNLRFGIPCVRNGRGQQSRSIIVHLEVFTNRATHASPLHRYAPTRPGQRARPFHGHRCVRLRNHDWRSSAEICRSAFPCSGGGRGQQSRSIVVHLEVFTNRATQCVAPTQICPDKTGDSVPGRFMGTVVFVRATMIGDHLRKSADPKNSRARQD